MTHARAGNEFEVFCVSGSRVEELHGGGCFVVRGYPEWNNVDAVEHGLVVHKELLSVPGVIKIAGLFRVLNTSGVSASDEVSDATVDSGRGVPKDFSWATIVHGRRPDGENNVIGGEGAVINESLMLVHTFFEWHVIVFAPSTEGVEEEDGVLVPLLHELFSGVLEEEAVTIVERVANLEGVASIGTFGNDGFFNFLRRHSVLVHAVIELNAAEEVHISTDEPVTLVHNVVSHGVVR